MATQTARPENIKIGTVLSESEGATCTVVGFDEHSIFICWHDDYNTAGRLTVSDILSMYLVDNYVASFDGLIEEFGNRYLGFKIGLHRKA